MPSPPKRSRICRQRLTIRQQQEIVELLAGGSHPSLLGSKYGVSRQTIYAIQKRANEITREHQLQKLHGLSGREFTRRALTVAYPSKAVDDAVLRWLQLVEERGANLNVTGDVLSYKALTFAGAMGMIQFKATAGWIKRFSKRYNITSTVRCGEASSVVWTDEMNQQLKAILHELSVASASPHCIWNVDEAALYVCSISAKSFAARRSARKKVDASKDRLAVWLGVSAAGEKLPL
ncbi:hypothetical protein ACHHYP_11149 [Achlya hypogyna]|uniref:HTH CENPB-type domain-containing protein n=1 Tax=Achlya hypogyna TaxID=1202772 RepID=A0A1V9YJP9_ACHHY|nr:hypothetical protein ACHHYP_11149 [Achlya hypogyna]